MKGYETICILHPDLTEEEVQETVEGFTGIITENGGEISKTENWGLRKLAYKVQGHPRGHFVYILYTGDEGAVQEFERNLRISESNIRYMTIKVDSVEETAKEKAQLLDDPTLTIQESRDGKF